MLGVLTQAGYRITQKAAEAGIIVINTCGFIEDSKKESIDQILDMAVHKETGVCHTLAVAGCLVQRYSQELKKEIPEIDLFVGTNEYPQIAEYLTALNISEGGAPVHLTLPTFVHDAQTPRILADQSSSAFLKIAEGCMKRCSFCIIPMMRGNLRSRRIPDLVMEAQQLAQMGIKELNLVAQDLSDYGRDLKPFNPYALPDLLKNLLTVKGIEWFRLFYCYPDGITDELIHLIKTEPRICNYIDMPLQHANDIVLKRMNRAITKKKMVALITKLRNEIPDISIRTSFIVGFPGETDSQFHELLDFITWAELDHVGVFKYSQEEGTPSYHLDEQIDEDVKRQRLRVAQELLNDLAEKKAATRVGTTLKVMVEGKHPESDHLLLGRSQGQAKEIDSYIIINDGVDPDSPPLPGSFFNVTISESTGGDLIGCLHP